jgi:hypothetical protein
MKNFNEKLLKIIEKRNQLAELNFNDKKYDKLEDQLHDLEDEFTDEYGDQMEEIIQQVQDKYNTWQEVLHPTAYIARKYVEKVDANGNKIYSVTRQDGVGIENTETGELKLVYVPLPARLVLTGRHGVHEVWNSEQPDKLNFM